MKDIPELIWSLVPAIGVILAGSMSVFFSEYIKTFFVRIQKQREHIIERAKIDHKVASDIVINENNNQIEFIRTLLARIKDLEVDDALKDIRLIESAVLSERQANVIDRLKDLLDKKEAERARLSNEVITIQNNGGNNH